MSHDVRDEVALLLSHLDDQRHLAERLDADIRRTERYTNTELMQMEQRTPRYSPYRYPEREKLQRRLIQLGKEQRATLAAHTDKVQDIERRLLSLVQKHDQL